MRWGRLGIGFLVLTIACNGAVVREEFRGVGQPAALQGGAPDFPALAVTSAEGGATLVEAYSWGQAAGSAGSGSRAPEHRVIETGELSLTLDLPYQGVAVLLTADGASESVTPERLGEGSFRLLLPGPGVWEVDLLAVSETGYATFAFTVEAG